MIWRGEVLNALRHPHTKRLERIFRDAACCYNIAAPMNLSSLVLSVCAAAFFVAGGALMKLSNGFARFVPGSAALTLFLGGAVVQTFAMKRGEMGVSYVFILGLEAVLAFVVGAFFFQETVSLQKVLGVGLIVGGFALLHVGASVPVP
jgi:multidrug transporter EmrE-like cation transporter